MKKKLKIIKSFCKTKHIEYIIRKNIQKSIELLKKYPHSLYPLLSLTF